MCNKEQLVGYLYDDLSAAERAAFEAHLASCVDCRAELRDLDVTRQQLASWTPSEPEFDFRIVRQPRFSPRPRSWVMRWGIAAAAATLVLAAAAGIARLEVRYGSGGLIVRTGWAAERPAQSPVEPSSAATQQAIVGRVSSEDSERLLARVAELTERIRALEESQSAPTARAVAAARPGISVSELRKILAEAESRQRTEMQLLIAQVWKDFNAARAGDFLRIQQTITPELQRQQRTIENLYRVSLQR